MISISSEAGIRLAKTHKQLEDAEREHKQNPGRRELANVCVCRERWSVAAYELGEELIAAGFHEYTEQGDKT